MSDTIAAVATGGSVSAIGIVRVSGPLSAPLMDALFRPADGKAMSQHRDRQLVFGTLLDEKPVVRNDAIMMYSPYLEEGGTSE